MGKLDFKGSWNQVKKKLKRRFGRLNDDDLQYSKGKEDQLLNRLQRRLGMTREEVKNILRKVK